MIYGLHSEVCHEESVWTGKLLLGALWSIWIERRKERTQKLNRPDIELYDELRSSQYRVNVLKYEETFDLIIENDKDFNYKINKNSRCSYE